MYAFLLIVHSWLRWVVLIAGLTAFVGAVIGMVDKRPFSTLNNRAGLIFTVTFDLQLLIGLLLYFVFSPLVRVVLQDFGGAMGSSALRFFALEHSLMMLAALVLAHIGRARIRQASSDSQKHRRGLIFYGTAVLLLIAAIPWPFLEWGRVLFRFGLG
mgnify:CR=1 FL=1